ncbi:MAG: DNA repair protein RadC [Prevotellaceae bacterium]|nr:DNA repair protein RadC [Prevotellaceae bacterium]
MDTTHKRSIKEWAEDDRPREKFIRMGGGELSKAELLAILIGSGNAEDDAVGLMRKVLSDCDDQLVRLGRMSPEELCQRYKGIGMAKAVTILAACELGKRRQSEMSGSPVTVNEAQDIYLFYRERLQDTHVEECHVLLLNRGHRIIDSRRLCSGGLSSTVVDTREVLRLAILNHATAIVLCHNHPSGNCQPSLEDDRLTEHVRDAARQVDIKLLDHIVISSEGYYSYAAHGKL